MAHKAQQDFFRHVKGKYPSSFSGVSVIDCGSRDINGTLRDLFDTSSRYIGVDIHPGKNVDLVSKIHDLPYHSEFDTVVSAEMLEHDEFWEKSMRKMVEMVRPNGLVAISAAESKRGEHGTVRTGNVWGTSPDYYMGMTRDHFLRGLLPESFFSQWEIVVNEYDGDVYFWGIRNEIPITR